MSELYDRIDKQLKERKQELELEQKQYELFVKIDNTLTRIAEEFTKRGHEVIIRRVSNTRWSIRINDVEEWIETHKLIYSALSRDLFIVATHPPTLDRVVKADLETIILKSIESEISIAKPAYYEQPSSLSRHSQPQAVTRQ